MRRKIVTTALALALSASGPALTPTAANAAAPATAPSRALAAPAFNASGIYTIFQSRGGNVQVNVTQDGAGRLFGSAVYGSTAGTIEAGSVDGFTIFFIIGWFNGTRGRYDGSLGGDRRLSGITFDLNHPSSQATWSTTRTF
ncbi:hypothetical protein GCM10010402_48340 [Actinomadura luteofluorescens]|uniref:hypothetical protein n=1 Tax=Actinomadura luteofluorescens TaxID=46163 RepID=UPI002164B40E|nr:hypothetical protein [Actinomadura glauciflava]MCR3742503.1 hypothetical protein [Actinomadura glauciflava]